jgi:polyisoprenyl-teichoic acid--peptidoglycan teichoic acid transferase
MEKMTDHQVVPIPKKKKSNTRLIVPVLLGVVVFMAACLIFAGTYYATRQIAMQWSGSTGLLGPQIEPGAGTPVTNALGTPLPPIPGQAGEAPSIAAAKLTPWDGAGRVTVLLLGLDYRDWEADQEASRSDTMILLTLDPQSKTAGIMSIPRDLWVSIPGFEHARINTAYYLGDAYQLPGGGPALAVKTVEQFIGVPINYYAQIDFAAFVRFIDEIGGVQIDVPAPITIDLMGTGAKTKKKLKAGVQTLPGEWALGYARNRYTENGDFDRAARQQQVIMGIRDQVLQVKTLPKLISKAPTLYEQLASGIRTNLSLDDVIRLALLAQSVPEQSIKRGIINKDNVFFGETPDGQAILIPIPDDIQNLRDGIFATGGAIGPQLPGAPQEQMKTEAARLAVYDGSGDPSLGGRTVEYLRGLGANVTQTGAADRPYSGTTIVDHTGNPYVVKYLVEQLHIAPTNITVKFDPSNSVDVELYLGSDLARLNIVP